MRKPLKMAAQKTSGLSLKNTLIQITLRLKRMDGGVTGHWKMNLKSSKSHQIMGKTLWDSIL